MLRLVLRQEGQVLGIYKKCPEAMSVVEFSDFV
jgi:hypothetical protein